MSVHWPIIRSLLRRPLRVAAIDEQRSWRSIEILIAALHLASAIEKRSRSETVGVLLPTSGLFPAAALASWMLGRVVVPINYLLSHDEMQWIVRHCETDAVVTVQPMLDHLGWTPEGVDLIRLEDVSFKGMPEPRLPATKRAAELAALLYTSGTSGQPKGVMLTHGNLRANIRQVDEWVDFTGSDVMVGALPQFHSFGFTVLTLVPLQVGVKVVYAPRFVPQKIVRLMREHRPTFFVGLPSMYNALLTVKSATAEDFASLRYAVSGGEPLPDSVFERFNERFSVRLAEGYGLTETAPVTNWCRPSEFRRGSVGRALPDVDVRIVDLESGRDLPAGRQGEIRIGGPNISPGYFKNPEETARMHDERGRLRTGDIGHLDRDGHLHVTGRHKEMLIISGENVFPREIEEALNQHPKVHASGVVGAPDPLRGEVPMAFIEAVDGQDVDEDELRRWVRERVGAARTPRRIVPVKALPKGPTGKIQRRKISELPEAEGVLSESAAR